MKGTALEDAISVQLCRWVRWVAANARAIAWSGTALTLLLGVHAGLTLGINSDNMSLIPDNLPSAAAHRDFKSLFLTLDSTLIVVVDAETPELARTAGDGMEAALRGRPDLFPEIYVPGGGSFFEDHGLLYRSLDDLDQFAEQMARMQPVMAELEQDPSIAQLAEIVQLALEDLEENDAGVEDWAFVLDRVGEATVDMWSEPWLATSWEDIFLRGSSLDATTRRVIVARPTLDHTNVFAASEALDAIDALARERGFVPERGVRVRVTGNPALNYEEMIGLMWDIGSASLFCFALVAVIVWVAVRSVRVMVAVIATLLAGLLWTSSYAALSVGHLNLISISFAVLFIGLGVDFGIHLGMSYASHRRVGRDHEEALEHAMSNIGGSLVLCGLTTAIGFFVFVPTDYRGIAELGLIATGGMVVIVFLFVTLFPALLSSWLRDEGIGPDSPDVHFRFHWWAPFERYPTAVRLGALLAFAGGVALLPGSRFDPNVVNMRDEETVSVRTFNDLLAEPETSPWYINVLAADLAAAQASAEGLRELPSVGRVITLADYVPADQDEKLEVLEDVAFMLDVPLSLHEDREGSQKSPQEQIEAIRALYAFFGEPWMQERSPVLRASIAQLRAHLGDFLTRVEREGNEEEALETLEQVLFANLPDQIARLKRAVSPSPVTRESLPEELVARMLADDGRARVQAFPTEHLRDFSYMDRFVREVQTVEPGATSVIVNLVEFGDVTVSSFTQALVSAAGVIMLLLFAIWRSPVDVLLAMTPLFLSAVLTGASMVVMQLPFDFSNVIVIPLLFGIGVDSGIHLVHRWKARIPEDEGLLGTTTARAVFYSALTTTASFGTLAFSGHNGMSILGRMLTAGMIFTVVCNLVVLPALLSLRRPPQPE